MKPSSDEGFILYTGVLKESCLNYLTHNLSISESSKSYAGYFVHSLFTSELTHRPLDDRGTTASREDQLDLGEFHPVERLIFDSVVVESRALTLIFFWGFGSYHIKTKYSIVGPL